MRIGFITASVSRNAGGLHESVRRLAQSINSSASLVSVFGLADGFTAVDKSSWNPLELRTFLVRGPRRFGFAPGLLPALQSSGVKLAMAHGLWMYPSLAVRRWHNKTGLPYIVHPHGMLDPWAVRNSAFRKRLAAVLYENAHLQGAACIRALCNAEAESIRAYRLANPICVIPNGIDLPDLRVRDQWSVISDLKSAGRKVLLFLSRIHPKKGLVNLLRAWREVLKHQSGEPEPWVLAIAGWDQDGHKAELQRLCTELGLEYESKHREPLHHHACARSNIRVVFLGPQFGEAKTACYRSCDAFILPSFSEGLPMAVLEAFAYAKPVLMTPECNLPEAFAAGAAIRLDAESNGCGKRKRRGGGKEEIEEGLRRLFAMSDSDRLAMGMAGRTLVSERFSWPKIAADMRKVYEWVLGGGTPPSTVEGV